MNTVRKFLNLNNGLTIPTIGLGTYKSLDNEVKHAVKYAIEVGYRHIDTARLYENEKEIGEALEEVFKEGKVKKEDLYIVTKLWSHFHDKKNVVPDLRLSLERLKLNYVDLFLIHWPFGFKEDSEYPLPNDKSAYSDVDYLETWEGMEECVQLGLAKSIGLSNFNIEQVERVLKNCKIKPVVNQIEINPNCLQSELTEYCQKNGIVVTSYCPLERIGITRFPNYPGATVQDPKVIEIAKKYGKTPAQVVLRFLLSLGVVIIPKSTKRTRILENFQMCDFHLTDEEVAYIKSRNMNILVSGLPEYNDHKYYPN